MSLSSQIMYWDEPKKSWFNGRVIAWAMFDLGTTIFSMLVISRYFGPWSINEMGGDESYFNDTYAASMLFAAILQILLSPISDELGRRRFFVVWFTVISIIACGAISYAKSLHMGLVLFAIANIGYRIAEIFYNAMLGDVSDDRHKTRVSGIGVGLGYVGSVIGLLVAGVYVDATHHHYGPVFRVTACLVFIFVLPLFLFVKEKPSIVQLDWTQSLRNSVGSFVTTIRRVVRHREMLFFFISFLLVLDAVHTVILNMTLYCQTVVGLDPIQGIDWSLKWKDHFNIRLPVSEIDLFLMTSAVFGIFGSFIIGHIADKTSRYWTLLGVIVLWMIALLLAIFSVQRKLFWVTGPLFGLGLGGIWTVSRAYLQELCHPEERSQMYALFGLVGRGAAIIGPFVWARVFQYVEPVLGQRKAYRLAISIMLGLMALGFWVMLLAKPKGHIRKPW